MPSDLREQPACVRTAFAKSELATRSLRAMLTGTDLTDFLNQRDRDYCIGMISSRWWAEGANVCGAGGR